MEIHNPPNLRLPPLVIEKQKDRMEMEKRHDVSCCTSSNLLLDKDFNKLYLAILAKSERIEELAAIVEKDRFRYIFNRYEQTDEIKSKRFTFKLPDSSAYSISNLSASSYGLRKNALKYMREHVDQMNELWKNGSEETRKEINAFFSEFLPKEYESILDRMVKLSNEIADILSNFNFDHGIELDILTHITFYTCNNCHKIFSRNKFSQCVCNCGKELNSVAETQRITIVCFSPMLRNFISKNYWFEYGIDYLLRRKNFQTLCGYYLLGHSGYMHEIDNIAESKSSQLRFFCECKTGDVGANDVFVLAGKMADIGCNRGYIFTLSATVSKEIIYLARSRNISIVTGVLEKSTSELLQEITE